MQRKDESEKKSMEGRKYSKLSAESIKNIAEVTGIAGLSEEMANRIAEDVTYRLREVLHHTSIFLRQSKRKKLLTSDILEVFEDYDVPPVYGYSSCETPEFIYVSEADVFVHDGGEEDVQSLAFDLAPLIQLGDPILKDSKTSPVQETPQGEPQATVKLEAEPVLPTSSTVDASQPIPIPQYLQTYYNRVASVILGSSKTHLEVILSDLYQNTKIGSIVPFLLNLLAEGLQKLCGIRAQFLQCISVLTQNKSIEFNSSLSVHRLVSALLFCALDTKGREDISSDEDYEIRSESASVLGKVVSVWCQGERKLLLDIVQKLGSVLLNGSSPLKSHYGAILCLVSLGSDALEYCLWPHLAQYLSFLETLPQDRDVKEVEGAILNASEILYQQESLTIDNSSLIPHDVNIMDQLLVSYFGDALCTRQICKQAITYEDNCIYFGKKLKGEKPSLKVPDVLAEHGEFVDFRFRKPSSFQLFLSNKGKIRRSEKRKHPGGEPGVRDVFDVPKSSQKIKKTMYGIEMNFAGGKPVPHWRLVRRQFDKSHSQFTAHSTFSKKCSETGFTGKHRSTVKTFRKQFGLKHISSIGDILVVL